MASRDFYELVASEWRARKVPLRPAAGELEIRQTFAQLGCSVSRDVLDLYTTVDGFDRRAMDHRYWCFWPLEQILKENQGHPGPFVLFADWLLWSHGFAFCYQNPEVSSVHIAYDLSSCAPEPIAADVAEFLEKLLCHPDEVWA